MTDRTGTPEARHAVINRVLAEQGRLDVAEVAEQLGVVPETVRRDLKVLESGGMLRRVHGGAIRVDPESRVPIPTRPLRACRNPPPSARVWAELPRAARSDRQRTAGAGDHPCRDGRASRGTSA